MDWQQMKSNPDYWQVFRLRASILGKIRKFFKNEGFLEVETPVLAPSLIPESYLEVFETKLKDKTGNSFPGFLTPSPELWHKKLLVSGSGNIFEITRSFRNTDMDSRMHNPEFTLLEWYRVGADYKDTMIDCEKMIRFVAKKDRLVYQGKEIDLKGDFKRVSVKEVFEKYASGNDPFELDEEEFSLIYVRDIEPNLGFGQPTFIYDFPAQYAPLAKTSERDKRVKERFELYMFGVELADAYTELNDPVEQKKEFEKEVILRKEKEKIEHEVDWDFIKALEKGLPSCSGVALGVDRLMMILIDKTDINQIRLFGAKDIFKIDD